MEIPFLTERNKKIFPGILEDVYNHNLPRCSTLPSDIDCSGTILEDTIGKFRKKVADAIAQDVKKIRDDIKKYRGYPLIQPGDRFSTYEFYQTEFFQNIIGDNANNPKILPIVRGYKHAANIRENLPKKADFSQIRISFHNHPSQGSFTPQDLFTLTSNNGINALFVTSENGTYLTFKTLETKPVKRDGESIPNKNDENFMRALWKQYEENFGNKLRKYKQDNFENQPKVFIPEESIINIVPDINYRGQDLLFLGKNLPLHRDQALPLYFAPKESMVFYRVNDVTDVFTDLKEEKLAA